MRKKRDFFDELGRRLDIPREGLPGGFSVTLSGRSELSVRGCRRILSYSPQQIVLRLSGACALYIEGNGLFCASLQVGDLTITGEVLSLRLAEDVK